MPYRKAPQTMKRYPPYNAVPNKDYISIPLPNERDATPGFLRDVLKIRDLPSLINFFKERIRLEELILLGLVFLLLDASFDDDILLILIIYILLF